MEMTEHTLIHRRRAQEFHVRTRRQGPAELGHAPGVDDCPCAGEKRTEFPAERGLIGPDVT
jgi:hypothetical protein